MVITVAVLNVFISIADLVSPKITEKRLVENVIEEVVLEDFRFETPDPFNLSLAHLDFREMILILNPVYVFRLNRYNLIVSDL